MFLKIIFQKTTLYFFAAGVAVNFLIFVFRSNTFTAAVLVSLVGGLVFCLIWCGIVRILMSILSQDDIAKIFNVQGGQNSYNAEESDDELTFNDLYGYSTLLLVVVVLIIITIIIIIIIL